MSEDDLHFLVFARIDQGDDLKQIGSVNAPNDRLARSYAQSIYDEEEWARMVVVDTRNVVKVPTDNVDRTPTMLEMER